MKDAILVVKVQLTKSDGSALDPNSKSAIGKTADFKVALISINYFMCISFSQQWTKCSFQQKCGLTEWNEHK